MGGFVRKCLICANSSGHRKLKENCESHSNIFAAWKNECSTAICDVLLGGTENCTFHYYLRNAEFCSSCQQIVRDIGLLWKQTKVIQNRISRLSARIRHRLNTNYDKIENKSEENTVNEKVLSLLQDSGTAVIENIPDFSYEEIVELIHAATILQHGALLNTEKVEASDQHQVNKILFKQKTLESIKVETGDYSNVDNDWQIDSIETQMKIDIEYENYCRNSADEDGEDDTASLPSVDSVEDDFQKRKLRNRSWRKQSSQKLMQAQKSKRGKEPKKNIEKDTKKRDKNCSKKFYCKEENCEFSFTTEENLKVHIFKLHKGDSKPHHCKKCPAKFAIKNALLRHTRTIHDNTKKKQIVFKYDCSFCGKRFLSEDGLTAHYSEAHQEPNPFMCAFCPEIFTNCFDLKKHTKESHPEPEKVPKCICDICGKSFTSNHSLKYHLRLHGDQNLLYSCSICDMKFTLNSVLTKHMVKHNNEVKYKCEKCGKVFLRLYSLQIHQNHSHPEKGFECRICGETLPTRSKWERHEISHNDFITSQIKRSQAKPKSIHECKYCGKSYKNEEEVNLHYAEAHLGPNPFSCAFCHAIFSNSYDLRKHMTVSHPEPSTFAGKIKCPSCDRYFSSRSGLKNHSVIHGDPSLLSRCHLCPKVFLHRHFLKRHLLRHTGERNCICETCGKSYKNIDDLKNHLRYHDDSYRKFPCKICDKKFITLSKCKQHERIHTDIKEFVCKVCGKAFNTNGNLTQHSKMHTGDGVSHIRRRKPKPLPPNSELQLPDSWPL